MNRFAMVRTAGLAAAILAVTILLPSLLLASPQSAAATTPPLHGVAKPEGLILYLPWGSGGRANVVAGSAYGENLHSGTDYYAFDFNLVPEGGDIYAVAPGTVIFAGHAQGYGNTVILQHDSIDYDSYYSQYAHLSATPSVSYGDPVTLDTVLGQEGGSDKAVFWPVHLHFALRMCDQDIAQPNGAWPSNISNTAICHAVVPEPFVGQHVNEGLGYWNYMVYNRILPQNLLATREREVVAWRPAEYPFAPDGDTTLPTSQWGADTPQNLQEIAIDTPLVYDMDFSDNQQVGEIRATLYYADWALYNLPGFDSNLVWRILARCDPRLAGSPCQNGHWRFAWTAATDNGFPQETQGLLQVPWMPKARAITAGSDACISFDVFDETGNARYSPSGGVQCSFQDEVQDNNVRRIRFTSTHPSHDGVQFVADVTLPDGSVATPGQALTKTWRLRNTGSTSWGSGYQLVFLRGDQMGAPAAIDVPTTATGQEVNLSTGLAAPANPGSYTGYWRLRNPQGTYFGSEIWIKINVQTAGSHITDLSADPPSPADTASVRIHARAENFPNFRAMRIKIDGEVKYELSAPEYYWDWNTGGYASGEHSLVLEVADQSDASWSHPEVRSLSYTLLGGSGSGNHVPNRPALSSPYDWYVYYSGNSAQLCAQDSGDVDGDAITGYYFEIYDSAQNWNSGWVGNNCVTTSALGPYVYQWRVKVHDEHNAESGWSDTWHFSLVNQNLSISQLYFEPQDPNSEVVKIRACTEGQGGVNITMKVSVNDANDGSDSGQWHIIKELGVPCFNSDDAPVWDTLAYGDGAHRVRVQAHGGNTGWEGSTLRDEIYTLPHRRPAGPHLLSPVPPSQDHAEAIYIDTRSIRFAWEGGLRATAFTLHISLAPSPKDDPNPVFRQAFGAGTAVYTATLDQDYPLLYWQVTSANDAGTNASSDQRFGIDRVAPTCSVQPLAAVFYDNFFPVTWQGTDDLAGLRFFDIQYQDSERQDWVDWLTHVPATRTYELFTGQAGHTYSFRCRASDQADNQGEYPLSADTSTRVDPSARPPTLWWDRAYSLKRNLPILNNMPGTLLPAGYPLWVHFDSTTTPTAAELYNASQSGIKCDDLRVVYQDAVEVQRLIPTCSPAAIDLWFRSQVSIPGGGGDSTSHQLYYGNAAASNPPADANQIWYPYKESDTVYLYFFQEGGGTTAYDSSGNNRHCTLDPSVQWGAGKWGNGLRFNRANGGSSRSLNCGSAIPLSSFTIEFWYRPDPDDDGRIAGELAGGGNGGGGNNWLLQLFEGKLRFDTWPCSSCGSSEVRGEHNLRQAPYVGNWNHIAVTFNGLNEVRFYINGELDAIKYLSQNGINTFVPPLEIGSVEGGSQVKANVGMLRISSGVKASFPYGSFGWITLAPRVEAGSAVTAPAVGAPDLAIRNVSAFLGASGEMMVQAIFQNQGNLPTLNGFYTDLYAGHVPSGPGDYTGSLSFWVNDPIAAGSTVTLTASLPELPAASGRPLAASAEVTTTLYAQIDSSGVISEANNANNIFTAGLAVCVATPDEYEGDDLPAAASLVEPGQSQLHNFSAPGDADWFKFEARQGVTYTLSTADLGNGADTYLYLYDTDAATLLASNDDYGGSLASRLEWQAPADGTYYLLVRHWNPNKGGCGTRYSLSINDQYVLFLPLIVRESAR